MALSLIANVSFAQKNPANESQLKKQANNFFEDEEYAKAYLQYSQLLSLYPQDPNYNYRFGACMLFSQSDKKKAIDYIETAVKQTTVENLAYFYLGRAYHLNYRFDDAIRAYQHFKDHASSSDLKKHPVDRLIEMCNNGKKLLGNLHDLDVLRKKELDRADYYQAYDLSSNGGTLLTEPDDFKTKTDKKKGLTSIIYLSPDRSKLFFASYGDDDKNGKDIYVAYRLPNGAWGKATNLGPTINTPYDEDYPFYDAPTQTLYFCSMGHNSMGGYDIFESHFNEATNSWSSPANMDFPINTPGDDILFIADTMNETAFFSSTRNSPDGRIAVYKINIEPHPPDLLVVKGTTYNDAGTTIASSRITVKNAQTNEVIGIFSSAADNGSYVMSLANGGHFIYTVETPNHKTQSESVTLPMQSEITPLQQQISYEASTDRLIVKNNSQGAVSDSNYLLAMDVIQKSATMDVNIDTTAPRKVRPTLASTNPVNPVKNPIDTAEVDTSSDVAIDTTGKGGVSSNQLEQIAKNDAMQRQTEAQSEKDDANRSIEYAANKLTESQQLLKQSRQLTAKADSLTDPKQKNDTLAKANQLKQQSDESGKKAMEAFQLASQQEIQAIVKQKEADQSNRYVTSLDSALKSPNKEKEIKKLQAQRDSLQKQDEANPPVNPTAGDLIRIQAQNAKQDSIEVVKHNVDLQKEADRLQQESDDYVAQAQKTDNANEKVALLAQARDLSNSKKEKENEIQESQKTLAQLHDQQNDLLIQARQIDSITKSNPESQQLAGADATSLKEDIKKFNPQQNSVTPTDTSHKAQQNNNPVVNNNPQQNPTQTNPNPIADTSHATQPSNPIVINNPAQNPAQANPNPTVDTSHATQPSNPIVNNNPTQNPTQTNPNPTVDSSHATQPNNPVVINNHAQNPTQTNPNLTIDTSHTTQPGNPVAVNNPGQSPVVQQNPAIIYSNPQATQSTKSAANFNQDAVTLSNKATDVRNQAKQTTDHTQAKVLYHRADSLDDAATEQRVVAALYINNADSAQYSTNQKQLNAWQTTMKNSTSEKVTEAQSLSLNANGYHDQYVKARQKADNITMPDLKQQYLADASHYLDTAIDKQQQAHDIMLAVNPDLKNITPSNVVDTTSAQPGNPVVINSPAQHPSQTNPSVNTSHTIQPGNPVVLNNPTQNPTQTNTNPTADTSHTTQPGNPVVINNPQHNPTQTNPNPTVDTSHATQPGNPVVINNPQHNPTQTNPSPAVDTSHATQPGNPMVINNPQHNPTQTNPNTAVDTNHATQPGNPVVVNNPQHNPTQTNPVAVNNPQHNPTQTNPGITTDGGHQTQPENNGLVNFPQQYQHTNVEDITESTTTVYSEAHPIPINPPLPEGLVYKVQIGAFKKPIKQTAFKGLEPIAGETTGKGYTRYTAGIFRDLGKANSAKNRVHKIGYRDAFVVAFYNGKRISMKQADALQNGTQPNQTTQPVAVNTNTHPANTNNPTQTNTPTLAPEQGSTAKSIPVNEVKGLFYTVQVGAYKTPVTADKLSNLSPLFSCSSPDGNIRYNCGIYSDVPKASAAKDVIVGKTSIKDAFVVAYYNGQRISIAEAAKLLNGKNASISQHSDLDKNPDNSTESAVTTHIPKSVFDTTAFPEGSVYTVQIADFIGEEPHEEENKVLGVAIKNGITIHKSNDGRTVYTVGRFARYKSADSMKTILERGDVPILKVVEYINNQPVDYEGSQGQPNNNNKTPGNTNKGNNQAHGTQGTERTSVPASHSTVAPTNSNKNSSVTPAAGAGNGKVTFSVQVGAYSGQIPINVANSLIKIASQGIATHAESNGTTSYTIGSYNNYASAKLLKEELVQDGFPGCFVVAYSNGKKISLQEAQSLINK
jgi:hypothetical protein